MGEKFELSLRRNSNSGGKLQQEKIFNIVSLCVCTQSDLTLCNPGTVACQVPLSMGFSR